MYDDRFNGDRNEMIYPTLYVLLALNHLPIKRKICPLMFGSLTTEKDKMFTQLLKFINLLDIFVAKNSKSSK